jgi:HNH endonuclease
VSLPGFSPVRRFQLLVWARGDCYEWRGNRTKLGYGRIWINGRLVLAHRFAFELAKGRLPAGLEPDHLCRHSWCVRPSHMEGVTHRTNMLRGDTASARAVRKTHCPKGHPYAGPNLYVTPDGHRECRICKRAAFLAFHERRRAGV